MIVYAALSCSCATGIDMEHQAAYDRVIGCMSEATNSKRLGQDLNWKNVICAAFKVRVKLSVPKKKRRNAFYVLSF